MSAEIINLRGAATQQPRPQLRTVETSRVKYTFDKQGRLVPQPEIAPDDPIFSLFDAYKEAKAAYDSALSEMARRCGLVNVNMAAILRAKRSRRHKAKIDADLHDLPEGVWPI